MRIDPGSHLPIYLQIVDGVRRDVAADVHRAGEALPSVRALAIDLGVNPNTVQRAYEELEREGLIGARRGLGMFVRADAARAAGVQARTVAEAAFENAARAALASGVKPSRLRKLFVSVLNQPSKGVRTP
jgi:GntR family transcriptional regulator